MPTSSGLKNGDTVVCEVRAKGQHIANDQNVTTEHDRV